MKDRKMKIKRIRIRVVICCFFFALVFMEKCTGDRAED